MPELPEVETIRADLDTVLGGKSIQRVRVALPKIVQGSPRSLTTALKGKTFGPVHRRGKLLFFTFADDARTLLLHLKMTGQLIFQSGSDVIAGGHSWPPPHTAASSTAGQGELPNKYSHVWFELNDGGRLFFNDVRQFGYVRLVGDRDRDLVLAKFGVEPLSDEFTPELLADILRRRQTTIKQVLLDQTKIAGLGNIYVDEAAFFAKIKPTRTASRLSRVEIKLLHRGIRHVLLQSLKHRGTTFNSFRDANGRAGNYVTKLKVYGRADKPCVRCKTQIAKTKVAGRGTHWCPSCQPR